MHILEIVSSSWSRSVWYSDTSSANSVSLLLVLLEAGVLIVVTGVLLWVVVLYFVLVLLVKVVVVNGVVVLMVVTGAADNGCSILLIGLFLIMKGKSVVCVSMACTATFSCFLVIGITVVV